MKKRYIGMAWPSDGLNDSEYWKLLPKNYELLISRYKVSGSLTPTTLKKEANLNHISKSIEKLNLAKLDIIILCDFASSVLIKDYVTKSENYFSNKFNTPCINIVSSTINFINKRKKNISIISPYNKKITSNFINLLPNKNNIKSVVNLSFSSELEIENKYKNFDVLNINKKQSDLLFIGGGVSISHFIKNYEKKYGYKVYSSPLILIKDVLSRLKK